jgi:two-component system sensor histidine kinase BaeS
VLVVAVTAIGATAFLTLSLTTRQVERNQAALDRHEREIVNRISDFGVRNGRWKGVSEQVRELSERTGLHIQISPVSGEPWIADSDNLRGLAAGPVESVPKAVHAIPQLSPRVMKLMPLRPAAEPAGRPKRAPELPAMLAPRDLFGPEPASGRYAEPLPLLLREVAQYRAALIAVRCLNERDSTVPAELATGIAPFLSQAQRDRDPDCVLQGTRKVLSDGPWLQMIWERLGVCGPAAAFGKIITCAGPAFQEAAQMASGIIEVEIYLGMTRQTDLGTLSRPALAGAAGLLVVAALGTAWIARRVSRPVGLLTEASRQLAAGRLDTRVPDAGRGELARLSASFNAMAEAVQRSEERQRRLVADVAHELRTPLSNLRGFLEGLSDGVIEPSRGLFASLHEETLLQRRILDDLQILALAEAGDLNYAKGPGDLSELASSAATAQRAVAADSGVAMTVDAPSVVPVTMDPDRMRQVLGNLLTNAIRYTDRGGQVLVRVRATGGEAELVVRDNGVGMSEHDQARVFDRFWRADPARQRATGGSGLGLTITRRIVTDHDGRIEVTSRPGEGSTFTVRLPLVKAHPLR